jgi:hypothetical protein
MFPENDCPVPVITDALVKSLFSLSLAGGTPREGGGFVTFYEFVSLHRRANGLPKS